MLLQSRNALPCWCRALASWYQNDVREDVQSMPTGSGRTSNVSCSVILVRHGATHRVVCKRLPSWPKLVISLEGRFKFGCLYMMAGHSQTSPHTMPTQHRLEVHGVEGRGSPGRGANLPARWEECFSTAWKNNGKVLNKVYILLNSPGHAL